jgi:hypothetical protein
VQAAESRRREKLPTARTRQSQDVLEVRRGRCDGAKDRRIERTAGRHDDREQRESRADLEAARHEEVGTRLFELLAQPALNVHRHLDHRAPPRLSLTGLREDDAVVSYLGRFAPAVAVSLAASRSSEPATVLTSSRSNTTDGDATGQPAGVERLGKHPRAARGVAHVGRWWTM